jgi:serine/threonine protein kinase
MQPHARLQLDAQGRNIKLVDFGFATSVAQGRRLSVFCGTPSYIAPEIIKRTEYAGACGGLSKHDGYSNMKPLSVPCTRVYMCAATASTLRLLRHAQLHCA